MAEFNEVFPAYQPRLQPRNDSDDFSKQVVIFSFAVVLLFYAICFFFIWHERFIPDSMIYSFTSLFGVELGYIAGIKIKKQQTQMGGF
jgi:hypothetical protein